MTNAVKVMTRNVYCCGALELSGMNAHSWTPSSFLHGIINAVASYKTPHKGQMKYAGYALFYLSYAYYKNKKLREKEPMEYREPKGRLRFEELRTYIEARGLGEVLITGDYPSATYGGKHTLRGAIYAPNNPKLVAFARERKWIQLEWKKKNNPIGTVVWG